MVCVFAGNWSCLETKAHVSTVGRKPNNTTLTEKDKDVSFLITTQIFTHPMEVFYYQNV